jgi:hypothetical protein
MPSFMEFRQQKHREPDDYGDVSHIEDSRPKPTDPHVHEIYDASVKYSIRPIRTASSE